MAVLLDLPTETLVSIVEFLLRVDLRALVTSQRTNRRFREVIHDVLFRPKAASIRSSVTDEGPLELHPLWQADFRGLFRSTDCFAAEERQKSVYLTLDGDHVLPFRRLPWTQTDDSREAHLRPEASWRGLSLTAGQPPITHLGVVKSYSGEDEDFVEYSQVDLPPTGLTMGMFYDILLCDEGNYGHETGSWDLVLGRRLRSYDILREYGCFIQGDTDLVDDGPEAP
ncbi:hypothetical protein BJ170DRAFT_591064 [Xylariales sp. AK1849]|nr:hypothetical protein BJ170DRAFT_591064 [Xylariales sp. AK1849]